MFGNSKEYQDLQKLYVDEVSKPENIDEFFGLGKKKKRKKKKLLVRKNLMIRKILLL